MKITKRKLWFLALLLALCVAALFLVVRNKSNGTEYKTAPVTKGDIRATVTATGTVNAVTTVLVGTQVSGTIKHIYVDFNSPVKKGQPIADIDPSTFQAQVDQARANLMALNGDCDGPVNIGTGVVVKFEELCALAEKLLPKLQVEIIPGTKPRSAKQPMLRQPARR